MRSTPAVALAVAALVGACNGSSATSGPTSSTPSPSSPAPTSTPTPSAQPMPPGPKCVPFETGKGCLPIAPARQRIDLTRPVFSKPTEITNPLHPSSKVAQVIYGGQVDGKPFRTEFTRLPDIKVINWQGQQIRAVTWQYLAFSDGRIQEVAIDWFAQADDGSVWYLGEDVFNYANGSVADTAGTWLTGRDGPPSMIMPATPKVGGVYRPENSPGVVFEEVTIKAVDRTLPGPSGPVRGVMVVNELHQDGSREDKAFAPGYGEFSTGTPTGDLEAASLAIPTDARPGGVPASLVAVFRAVRTTYDAVSANRWSDAAAAHRSLTKAFRPGTTLLDRQMARDLGTLGKAIANRGSGPARQAVLRVAQNDLDLRLRYLPLATVERARFDLWIRQIAVDADEGDAGSVIGDATTLKWTWDRIRPTLGPSVAKSVDGQVKAVQAAANRKDLKGAARTAAAIRLHS